MESIKQEIVNNVYENGEQLITGPVLQEVLLDIVDDYNGKIRSGSVPQDLVGKTGSWDDAADWIEDNSGSLVHTSDLEGYATEQWVEDQGYLTEHQDISGLATTQSVNELSESVETLVNETSESVKEWVEAQRYLTSASLSGSVTEETVGFMINDATASVKGWVEDKNYATETYVSESIAGLDIPSTEGFATTESLNQLSESVAQDFANLPQADLSGYLTTASYTADSASFDERINAITGSDLSGYATTESLNQLSESVAQSIADIPEVDLSGYATTSSVNEATQSVKEWVQGQGYLTEHQDISGLATTESVNNLSQSVAESIENIDLSEYATTSSVESSISEATESVKEWVEAQRYLTTASLSGSVTEESVQYMINDSTSSVKTWVEDQNYATETFVSEAIAAIPGTDLTGYATEAWVQEQGYLTEHQDISGLATTQSVTSLSESVASLGEEISSIWDTTDTLSDDITSLSESVARDLENYVQERELTSLSESISSDLESKADDLKVTNLSESVATDITSLSQSIAAITGSDLSGYATTASVNQLSESVAQTIENLPQTDLSGYLQTSSYLVDSASFDERINAITGSDLSGYATTQSVNQLSESVVALSESVDGHSIDIEQIWGTITAVEDAGVIEWNDESEEYTAIPVATSESVARSVEDLYDAVAEKADARDLTSLSESVASDVADLSASIAAITGSDLSGYATTQSVNDLSSSVGTISSSFAETIANIPTADLSGYATTESVNQLSESVAQDFENLDIPDVSVYATTASLNTVSQSLSASIAAVTGSSVDLSEYATTASLNSLSQSVSHSFGDIHISDSKVGQFLYQLGLAYPVEVCEWDDELEDDVCRTVWTAYGEGDIRMPLSSDDDATIPAIWIALEAAHLIKIDRDNDYWAVNLDSINQTDWEGNPIGQFLLQFGDPSIVAWNDNDGIWYSPIVERVVEIGDTYATTSSVNSVSQSLSASIAAIEISGGGSDTDLRNYLFGVATQQVTGITGSVTNIFSNISQNSTLGFSNVPDEGRSLSITVHNNAASTSTITLPESVVVGSDTFNLINNGVDGPGSMSIFAGEYGDIVVTRHGSDIFVRTSVNLDDINVDLSGYATTASLNSVSESISQSIADIPAADLSGYATTESVNTLSASFDQRISNIPGSDIDLSGYATTESVNTLSASFAETIDNIPAGSGSSGNYLPLTGGTLTGNLKVEASVGVGVNPAGNYSLAVGEGVSTDGAYNSVAVGESCRVSVYDGFAAGRETVVEGDGAFGMVTGFRNRVTKMAGYAGGCRSTASGEFATAIGFGAEAAAKGQVVLGAFNVVDRASGTGSYAVILGNGKSSTWNQDDPGNVVRSNGLAIKWDGGIDINYSGSTITLQDKIAELEQGGGWVTGNDGTGAKIGNTNSWKGSIAEGTGSSAWGEYSHAEGYNTLTLESHSHAEGHSTIAAGIDSHAEGNHTRALGIASHAEGLYTTASGQYSHAEGYYTETSNAYEHAQGRYNATASSQIFSIGVGDDTTRKNAVSVVTGSASAVFVLGIGGYDGTNPNPGVNDIASVISSLEARIAALEGN